MFDFIEEHHPRRRIKSFRYAFQGLFHALLNEANFRIQIFIVIFATVLGVYFKISNTEWGLLILSMGFLLSAEMVNTVVEEFIDHLIKKKSETAKIIKDLGAGFVLVTAAMAALILYLIFGVRLMELFVQIKQSY